MAQLPRYRDAVRPAALDVSADNGSARAADQLGQIYANFGAQTAQVAGGLATQAGEAAGTQAGAFGTPEPKEGFTGLSAYGRAYNSAAEVAYLSKTQRDVLSKMDDIERQSEADPEKFETLAGAVVAGYEDVLPEYKARVVDMIDRQIIASRSKILDQKLTYDRHQHIADYSSGTEPSIKATVQEALMLPPEEGDKALIGAIADNDAKLAAMQKDHTIDPVAAEQLSASFKDGLAKALDQARATVVLDKLTAQARADVEVGDQMFSQFMAKDGVDPQVRAIVEQEYGDMRSGLLQERSRTHAEFSADFSARLARGEYGAKAEADARQLYRVGASSVDEFQGFMAHIAQNEKAAIEDGVDISRVTDAMSQQVRGLGLDPRNPADQKAVNSYFKHVMEQSGYAPGSSQWQAAAERVANRTNVLPDAADSFYRRSMMSEDPTRVAQGAAGAARIMRTNKVAWDYNRDPKITAYAMNINDMLEAGVPVVEAVNAVNATTFDLDDKKREQLHAQYGTNKRALSQENASYLQGQLNHSPEMQDPRTGVYGFFRSAPTASADMQSEYDKLVRVYYTLNDGDVDKAREVANQHLMSTWGFTTMNGTPELVKYPPEKMNPNLTSDAIIADKTQTLRDAGYTGDASTVKLATIPGTTDRSNGVIWALVAPSPYGGRAEPVLDGRNQAILFRLDTGSTAARDAAQKHKRELIEAAAQRRVSDLANMDRPLPEGRAYNFAY